MQDVEAVEIDLLLEGLFRCYGHDFRRYHRPPIRSRVQSLMRHTGLPTVSALQDRVMHDSEAAETLLRALSERPGKLFDDAANMHALRAVVVPLLRTYPSCRVWIAECVSAEDVCALAIMLAEERLHDKTQIFATAENETLLGEARTGRFARDRLDEYAENYRKSGGKADFGAYCGLEKGGMVFAAELRANVTWAQHSLATDASFNEFQLILCRRTLSDFDDGLRQRVLQLFYDSMSFLGVLSVDGEACMDASPFNAGYQPISQGQGLYRRIA